MKLKEQKNTSIISLITPLELSTSKQHNWTVILEILSDLSVKISKSIPSQKQN